MGTVPIFPNSEYAKVIAMGLCKFDLPTPSLLVDLDRLESNLRKLQETITAAGKNLRPHAKAHKCVEIARRQVELGAAGVCVATIGEMELMTSAGIGVLLTTPVASTAKTDRIAALARAGSDVQVVVDHAQQVRMYQNSAAGANTTLRVLADLDIGDHRTGIPCDDRAISLAEEIESAPNLRFAGLQAYSVSGSHTEGWEARRTHSFRVIGLATAVQKELLRRGIDATALTVGSTGTWNIDITIPEVTELQAGSYPLMDVAYRRIGGADFDPAMTVLTTVISCSHTGHVTVDGGFKAFATDRPFGPEAVNLSGVRWQWAGDEHGLLFLESTSRNVRLGEHIEFVAPHCDPTVNLYNRIYACRGDAVEAVWPLKRSTLEAPPL
jgi:D-serine deaminase-like pyridoxal phosphate-dependent protein